MNRKYDLNLISHYRSELMGIAILLVIAFHYTTVFVSAMNDGKINIPSSNWKAVIMPPFNSFFGSIGVELFVVLSAIGLYYSYSRNEDAAAFYKRRLKRIIFPYMVVGTAFWVMKDLVIKNKGILQVVKDLSFLTFFTSGTKTVWFILFILGMYLIFPFLYRFLCVGTNRVLKLCTFLVLYIGLAYIVYKTHRGFYSNVQIAMLRVPLFAAGCYLAPAVKEHKKIPVSAALLFIALSMALNVVCLKLHWKSFYSRLSDSVFGLGLLFLLTGLCAFCIPKEKSVLRPVLAFFGKYSLEFYMIHVTLRNLMGSTPYKSYQLRYYLIMLLITACLSVLLRKVQDRIIR